MNKIAILNRDVLKYIAIIAMTFNHIAHILLEPRTTLYIVFEAIGMCTAITMLYLMVEGFHYTKSRSKYLSRLMIFAIISQLPFGLMANDMLRFNVMFSFAICFLIMCILESKKINVLLKILLISILTYASLYCDWFFVLPISTICFYFSKSRKLLQGISFGVAILLAVIPVIWEYQISTFPDFVQFALPVIIPMLCAAIACLFLYNHKQINKYRAFNKYMFYVYYPTHIAILLLIKHLINL